MCILPSSRCTEVLTYLFVGLISGDSALESSYVWYWMRPAVSCLFGALWVLPLYWISKPLNSLWFQVINDLLQKNLIKIKIY